MDNWTLGISLTILGMGTVFLVLAVLAVAMVVLNRIYDSFSGKAQQKKQGQAATIKQGGVASLPNGDRPLPSINKETITDEPLLGKTQSLPAGGSGTGISPQVIAAITAAVAALLEKPVSEIQLASVRKVNDIQTGGWVQRGRIGLINSRLSFYERKGTSR